MLGGPLLDLRRRNRFRVVGLMLALSVVQWMPVSITHAAGKSIFDNDSTDSTQKPNGGEKPAPRPAPTPPPPPAEPIPPAPATSPAPSPANESAPKERALPLPSSVDISRSAKLLKELFATEFADHTTAGRRALAATMMKNVDKNSDDPSAQYVLLNQARDLAASAGDVSMVAEADSELSERFRVPPKIALKTRLTAMSSAVAIRDRAVSWSAAEASAAIDALRDSADASTRLNDLASADKFVALIQTVARTSGDPTLINSARACANRQRVLREESDAVALAQATLSSNPADPSSNLAVGRYLCDVKLDWQRGLPLLTRGSDGALKELAQRELTPPGDASEQESLGSAWWDAAEKSPPAEQDWLRRRALYWYQRAAPSLDGLAKVRAENRIEQHPELLTTGAGVAMGGAKIVNAVYGAGDRTADLTELLQKALDQDPYMPIVAINNIIGDPAPYAPKSLKVHYAWRGKEADIEIGEASAGVVPAIPEGGLPIRGASSKFKIVAVRWGWGAQCRDITALIAPLLQDPTTPFSPPDATLEPDPAFGVHKWLVIWFDLHGRRYARLCRDDAFPITLLPAN